MEKPVTQITSAQHVQRQQDTTGTVYMYGWAVAGALALGWWQGSIGAGIFGFVLLFAAIHLSMSLHEVMELLRVGVHNQEQHIGKTEAQANALPQVQEDGESFAIVPLKAVYTFGLCFYQAFLELAKITPEEWEYAKAHGKFIRELTVERWTNHSVVRVSEEPASSEPEDDPTVRSFNVYGTDVTLLRDTVCLWRLPLGPKERVLNLAPALELHWKLHGGECFRLVAIHGRFGCDVFLGSLSDNILLSVPLEPEKLSLYKTPDDDMNVTDGMGYKSKPWRTSYGYQRADKGISWTLWIRDFELWSKGI